MVEKRKELPERPRRAVLDDKGRELLDPVPMAPPVGFVPGMSQDERLRQMIRQEHSRLNAMMYNETFEEANDLDIDDDPIDPSTPYEESYDVVDLAVRQQLRDDEYRSRFLAALNRRREQLGLEPVDGNGRIVEQGREEPSSGVRDEQDRGVDERSSKDAEAAVSGSVRSGDRGVEKGGGESSRR